MRSGNLRSFVVAALATVATVWATGCAQGVGTIDRTQAHRIDKAWLNDGKPWYFLQTVVDSPPTTNFTFVGEASFPPDRIVWSVQENWLYAYRNYEWIVGSQTPYSSLDHGTAGGSQYFGAPIAAYKVTSHFDVQRDYNAQTGEQTNVIEENTTDRPWYQRQYMHVDWSNNGLNAFDFLNLGLQNSTTLNLVPVAYYPDEEDPTNKDRAEITPNYIGIVNKMTYQSEIDAEATQQLGFPVYKCFLWTNAGIGDCGPGEVKVRLSFKKIEDDHDFFPRNYTDKDVNMFGVWQMQRAVYDPERGYLTADFSANSMAVMHHIWQKDHYATDPTSPTQAPCDIHDFSNPNCELPLNQRNPKPIVYYVSEEWPALGDPNHKTMWLQAKLLAEEYNDDMRGVVAAARRGGVPVPADPLLSPVDASGNPVANFQFQPPDVWAQQNGMALQNTSAISYQPNGVINYRGAQGLDYLAYPPDTRQLAFSEGGYDAMVRPNVTLVNESGDPCTADQVAAGSCTTCDPKTHYCMGIGHLPYTVVPRMFAMCHNPVQPRIVHQGDVLPDGTTYAGPASTVDKSDPTKPESYDFSTPGDPNVCDPRADKDRKTAPLNPQLGDLRYHMLAWIPQPDISSPGGIGEPAMDPVTGEIISSHAYIYARAVEGLATYGADLVAVLNGWENVNDYVQGSMVKDYVIATQNRIPPIFSGQRIKDYVTSAPIQSKIQKFQYQVSQHLLDPGGPGDVAVSNWKKLSAINDPRLPTGPNEEILRSFAPEFGINSSGSPVPDAVASQFSYANLLAPDSVSTWDRADQVRAQLFAERHILDQAEIEPTAVRLAQYYKNQLAPGATTNPCTGDSSSPVYRTCIWEAARQEILGNLWRSYSDHEVGHTFGQYHNFAGSTDALNYFDPYWDIRKENTISVSASATDPNGKFMFSQLGSVPSSQLPGGKTDTAVLAPEFMQAPTQQSLLEGLREYQYTSIMDYNSKFNADFQGIGKYDHACHMYQYARQVEVFDPDQLSKVPANTDTDNTTIGTGQPTHPHQVADELLIPFNRHYTFYPWLINDGLSSEAPNGKKTPLGQGIAKMIHARKWVSYNDLMNGISTPEQAKVNGFDDPAKFNASLMVPYRFCSDTYNQGQAHCLWFDEGADPYEQAIGFINAYKLNYFFNNFKHGSATFAPQESAYTYLNRLWQRSFQPLVRIFQHALNDEFIVRFDPKYNCGDASAPGGSTSHVNGIQCGMDRLATQATIMDFYAKILQTPNTGQYGWVSSGSVNTYCSTESGHCNPGTPSLTNSAHPALMLAAGDTRYDESQWDINRYGHLYMYQPTVLGNWYDKFYAVKAMTDYYSYIIGAENSKPFNYLISLATWFSQDVSNAIGGLFVDDQNWAPKVGYYAADPNHPDHTPVVMYRNTEALRDIGAANVPNEPWCTAGTGTAPPGLENCPSSLSFTGAFDHDEAALASIGYTNQPLNPGPVYYERTLAMQVAVIWMTSEVDNLQFLRTIKVNMKGPGTFDNTAVQALSCSDGSACLQGAAKSCEDGNPCPTGLCQDSSQCILRSYTCAGGAECDGVCMDPANPTAETCNPRKYAEFTDVTTGNTYFATSYNAASQAPFSNLPQAIPYYSIGYELVKQAASAARLAPSQPLSSVSLLDILRSLYYYWSYDPYFSPHPPQGQGQ